MQTFITFLKRSFLATILLFVTTAECNNIAVSNTTLTGQNNGSQFVGVKFDLQWENSWRNDMAGAGNAAPFNWDAAWIFVKFRECGGVWRHATLSSANGAHTVSPSALLNVGLSGVAGKGAFIYRSANGSGNFFLNNVGLRWEYGVDGLINTANVEIRVFAEEMVYVTQGILNLPTDGGGGGSGTPTWVTFNNASLPSITSEGTLAVGALRWNGAINGGYCGSSGNSDLLSANYPKGFAPYYCMKYPLTCKQYADFLNTLTFTQQQSRICPSVSPAAATGAFVFTCNLIMSGQYTHQNSIIGIKTSGVLSSVPAVFGCDLNGNGTFNEANDGMDIIASNVYNEDQIAYADWSGLRPMSLLEYEKACRGTNQPAVINEFAWGTPSLCLNTTYTVSGSGSGSEIVLNTCPSGIRGNALVGNTNGPALNNNIKRFLRAGSFATASSDRLSSGATYYGIMHMSETIVICVSVSERGRTATGPSLPQAPGNFDRTMHGDGLLSPSGDYNGPVFATGTPGWPGVNGIGIATKGGAFCCPLNSNVAGRVSDLSDAALNFTRANYQWTYASIRCVRSAP